MNAYVGQFLIFMSALVAIVGGTWDSAATGIRKLTLTGRIAALLAISGLTVGIITTRESEASVSADRALLKQIPADLQAYRAELLQIAKQEGATDKLVQRIQALPLPVIRGDRAFRFEAGRSELAERDSKPLQDIIGMLQAANVTASTSKLMIVVHTGATQHVSRPSEFDRMLPATLASKDTSRIRSASNMELAYLRGLALKFKIERLISEDPKLRGIDIDCLAGEPLAEPQVEIRLVPK